MKRSQIQRRTPLRAMSAKRRHALAQRKRVRRIVIERDGGCVGKRVWPEVECDGPLEVDELRGGAYRISEWLDPDRCQALCSQHHRIKTANKREFLRRLEDQ